MAMTVFDTSLYKDFPFRKIMERNADKYIGATEIAGYYLQERMNYWGKEEDHYEWLHLSDRTSLYNDLCFIYQNNVFSVLLEINNQYRNDSEVKQRFLEHCKKNDMIPCLFPVTPKLLLGTTGGIAGLYVDDKGIPDFTFEVGSYPTILQEWKENQKSTEYIDGSDINDKTLEPTNLRKQYENISNWNLINAITYEPVFPHKLAINKSIKPSPYEFLCRAINFFAYALKNVAIIRQVEMGVPQMRCKTLPQFEYSKEDIARLEEDNTKDPNQIQTYPTKEVTGAIFVKVFDNVEQMNSIKNLYKFDKSDIFDIDTINKSTMGIFCGITYEDSENRCSKFSNFVVNINKLYFDNNYCYLEFEKPIIYHVVKRMRMMF